ncbi:hypothetical protein EXN66_Car015189 [Channa argus]|uniref:Kisspeptin 2 n=1 Tax=Channa argus TaxID=215402 RepID=A0A6G1QAD4_CHAAH|nr:hypothetical protein EXN66_Car015189 [Channa argus]
MRVVALVMVWGLIVGQNGRSVRAALPGFGSAYRTQEADELLLSDVSAVSSGSVFSTLRRRTTSDFLADDPNLCFSLRENEDQRQLLCNDRRSNFNFNPFGLRFGKRYNGYIYRRAVKRARTNKFSPLMLLPRELEVLSRKR